MSTRQARIPTTAAIDTSPINNAIGLRRGVDMLNSGVLTPHTKLPLIDDLDSLEAMRRVIWEPPGVPVKPNTPGAHHLIVPMGDRLIAAYRWLRETYCAPDEVVHLAIEAPRGKLTPEQAISLELAYYLHGALGGDLIWTNRNTKMGARHWPSRGGNGDALSCYPACLVGSRPTHGAPDRWGRPVLMLPNEHRAKRGKGGKVPVCRRDDEQAVYDLAAMLHYEEQELREMARAA